MEMEQYQSHGISGGNNWGEASLEKSRALSAVSDGCEANTPSACFDCNICLEVVQDPVVTLCGHLYCWPCIYKWIRSQTAFDDFASEQQPQCPVCKAEISEETVVPLYGRGQTPKSSKGKASHLGIVVPKRPSTSSEARSLMMSPQSQQHFHNYGYPQRSQLYQPRPGSYPSVPMMSLDGTVTTDALSPMDGMFGKMVFQRIFGNPETTLYAYPNSYHHAGSNSPRLRRHMMQADRSLSRVSFFLFCCIMFCLLLF